LITAVFRNFVLAEPRAKYFRICDATRRVVRRRIRKLCTTTKGGQRPGRYTRVFARSGGSTFVHGFRIRSLPIRAVNCFHLPTTTDSRTGPRNFRIRHRRVTIARILHVRRSGETPRGSRQWVNILCLLSLSPYHPFAYSLFETSFERGVKRYPFELRRSRPPSGVRSLLRLIVSTGSVTAVCHAAITREWNIETVSPIVLNILTRGGKSRRPNVSIYECIGAIRKEFRRKRNSKFRGRSFLVIGIPQPVLVNDAKKSRENNCAVVAGKNVKRVCISPNGRGAVYIHSKQPWAD